MGTTLEHVAKWKHNRDFLATIPDKYCDWTVTVAFYTAVHAVEAVFAKDSVQHEGSHKGRNQILKLRSRYHTVWRNFRPLWAASQVARYHCDTGPSPDPYDGWISPEDVKMRFVQKNLGAVEALAIQLLGLPRQEFPPFQPTTLPPTGAVPPAK